MRLRNYKSNVRWRRVAVDTYADWESKAAAGTAWRGPSRGSASLCSFTRVGCNGGSHTLFCTASLSGGVGWGSSQCRPPSYPRVSIPHIPAAFTHGTNISLIYFLSFSSPSPHNAWGHPLLLLLGWGIVQLQGFAHLPIFLINQLKR